MQGALTSCYMCALLEINKWILNRWKKSSLLWMRSSILWMKNSLVVRAFWVQIQHPPAQWNLRGGRWSTVEYCTITFTAWKISKKTLLRGGVRREGLGWKWYQSIGFSLTKRRPHFQLDLSIPQGWELIEASTHARTGVGNSLENCQFKNEYSFRDRQLKT